MNSTLEERKELRERCRNGWICANCGAKQSYPVDLYIRLSGKIYPICDECATENEED